MKTLDFESLLRAINFAVRKHQGQVRKDQHQSPYVTHPIAVAESIVCLAGINDPHLLKVAILHDTIEDTNTTPSEIRKYFGEEVLSMILEVTDDKTREKMDRKRLQVIHAPQLSYPAKIIKLADKLTNCLDVLHQPPAKWSLERRRDYIQWAADVIAMIRGTDGGLETAFDQMLKEAEEKLHFQIKPYESINSRPWGPNPNMPEPS